MENDYTANNPLDKAEALVSENLAKFESAMERLTEKMEDSGKKIQHLAELAAKQKDEFVQMKDKFKGVVDPIVPYFKQTASKVQSNPKPIMWAAVCLVGGYFLINYFGRKGLELPNVVDATKDAINKASDTISGAVSKTSSPSSQSLTPDSDTGLH
jgi:hypothetical protein